MIFEGVCHPVRLPTGPITYGDRFALQTWIKPADLECPQVLWDDFGFAAIGADAASEGLLSFEGEIDGLLLEPYGTGPEPSLAGMLVAGAAGLTVAARARRNGRLPRSDPAHAPVGPTASGSSASMASSQTDSAVRPSRRACLSRSWRTKSSRLLT